MGLDPALGGKPGPCITGRLEEGADGNPGREKPMQNAEIALAEAARVLLAVATAVCAGAPDAVERIGTAVRLAIARNPADADPLLRWLAMFETATGEA